MSKVEQLFAFIVEDSGPDDEGVIALLSEKGVEGQFWLPLVGSDMARVDSLRSIAKGIGGQIGKKVKLARFTNREDLEEL